MATDYYSLLEITPSASAYEIRKAFRKLARKYHPDVTGGNNESADKFKQINEAYHILSDAEKRSAYDSLLKFGLDYSPVHFEPYLHAEISDIKVKLNGEFVIKYSYGGEGRVFEKPSDPALIYLSSPVVDHRGIAINNGFVKETILAYTVCAVKEGMLKIPSASIYINHRLFKSQALQILITGNDCFFTTGQKASVNPLPVHLNKEHTGNTKWRRTYIYRHLVLIPRSSYAHFYHRIGATLKIVFAILGIILSAGNNTSLLIGFSAGSLAGGILCYSMYLITAVKPKFYYSLQYPLVKKYREEGYNPGRDPSYGVLADKSFYLFFRLFI
jgi:curved DNA-binding protein CbpA